MLNKFTLALGIVIFIHVFILTKLIYFPYPELFIYPYLTNQGLKPYQQILDQHFPGLMFLPINFNNLGMTTPEVARVWLIGIVILTQILIFFISREILNSGKRALLVNIFYLIWQPFFEGWVFWIDSFLPLLLLPAFYFTIKKKFFLSGLFIGLAIVFKQTVIPLGLLIFLYLLWEKEFRSVWRYFLGGLIPVSLMVIFVIQQGYFADFWYWTVVFNLTVYAPSGTQIPTSFGFILRVLVVYSTALAAFFYKDRNLKIILFLFLIGSLAGAFDRSNFIHFQPSLPFVVIATALGFYSLGKTRVGIILMIIYGLIAIWWQSIFYKGHISDKVFFFDEGTFALSNKIRQYTKPNDKIFVFGAAPHLYQMSETLPAGDIFVFQFPWFLKVAEDRILEGLKKDRVEIVVSDRTVKIEKESISDFASKIDNYIMKNYQEIDSVGNVKILKKRG